MYTVLSVGFASPSLLDLQRAARAAGSQNPTGNEDVTRIRNFFAALSRRFRGFRGAFAGFAALSRRFRAASHTAQWCLRKDSQPFRKVSQLRIRVTSSLPVGFFTIATLQFVRPASAATLTPTLSPLSLSPSPTLTHIFIFFISLSLIYIQYIFFFHFHIFII